MWWIRQTVCFDWHYQYQPVGGSWLIFHCRRDLMFAVTEEKIMEVCPKAGKILFFPLQHTFTPPPFLYKDFTASPVPFVIMWGKFFQRLWVIWASALPQAIQDPLPGEKIWQIGWMMPSDSVQMFNGDVCGIKGLSSLIPAGERRMEPSSTLQLLDTIERCLQSINF